MKIIVEISDARVTGDPNDVLVTYSLGSCIGVALYDPAIKIGGMLHYQLPDSRQDLEKSRKNPFMYADSGMQTLINEMTRRGANPKRLKTKIAGGAQMMNDARIFQIGKRNYAAIRQILWKNGLFIDGEDIGGDVPRTMFLNLSDGAVIIKARGNVKPI